MLIDGPTLPQETGTFPYATRVQSVDSMDAIIGIEPASCWPVLLATRRGT